jgi:hypothetical protein
LYCTVCFRSSCVDPAFLDKIWVNKLLLEIDFGPIWISSNWLKIYIFVNTVDQIKLYQVPLKNAKHTWKGPQEYTEPTWNKVPLMLRPRGMTRKNISLLLSMRWANVERHNPYDGSMRNDEKFEYLGKCNLIKNRIMHCNEKPKTTVSCARVTLKTKETVRQIRSVWEWYHLKDLLISTWRTPYV